MSKPPPQEVRLIGGLYKRTPLPVPVVPGLRPTSSRVRETLFNWLGQDMSGWRVLDAFAGSGALGLEAASRGASAVTLLEQHPQLVQQLSKTAIRLGASQVNVHRADAINWMSQCAQKDPAGSFDLVFLDPPFEQDLFLSALQQASRCVVPQGWIYLESPQPWHDAHATSAMDATGLAISHVLPAGFTVQRRGHAGAVHFHLLQCERSNPACA
jgi:16S rRNA (guanine966-N2)-methyltransferase